ncbi:MAG: Acyl carrier protein [Candidatus Curtissbacteria bacterium GW2011_GWA1_40_47]|uniref:Carrier domain-containing protein n=1 Tax=Candidatus Curtissbacteria bacterium RIFOXYA1_FULL_41_14 TaxID=1797737 RepID=A0A1F5HGB4_9BACT|nr:MAG: Acyl carrier protein [Candidatus Curtissbacteria bacterium GW2011_GWB1_40_28]KKR61132.1 MAG: Acyl carrier protein [Candidatus Curtissbacteria bacterium GW2011_GWA2_40_31]KKR61908.1 MAG: Acyl carrier protein [Microgenomates group bacterium GW2011_GWC1_40_35]KKR65985.1 MAG: Acyl carrier protein [Candidatus Curtissbacteria bacterium GW2011_GWA1_40_47]KKR76051.1 MAG: Acyl carrier protein [Candidatus Curtissbacteria bacterium GW2011_GWD1_40_8]KKS02180.1 MAG: Acyl carrier protein [Candidatus
MIDYLEDIKKLISKQFGITEDDIEEDSFLEADLNITDLDLEDLLESIQDKYQIQVPTEKVATFKKVSDIVSYLFENVENAV